MPKLPKFLLFENPLVFDEGLFILHTRKPRMLIRIEAFLIGDEEGIMEFKKQLPVAGALEYKDYYYIFYPEDVYDEIPNEGQKTADDLAKLMRRVADWYKACLIFEDSHYDSEND